MKTSITNNLKKTFAFGLVALLPLFTSCGKDKPEPSNPQQSQKHNVNLVYGKSPSTQWQNISIDTLSKYNSDPTVDTIFMIPKQYQQFSGLSTNALKQLVTRLRDRHNINPNKIFGKGNLELAADAVQNNNDIVLFFADTLKYNVSIR